MPGNLRLSSPAMHLWAKYALVTFTPFLLTEHNLGPTPIALALGLGAGALAYYEFVEPFLTTTTSQGHDLSALAADQLAMVPIWDRDRP